MQELKMKLKRLNGDVEYVYSISSTKDHVDNQAAELGLDFKDHLKLLVDSYERQVRHLEYLLEAERTKKV